ncbi:uncharacterized protein MONBRDRAFT_6652 [Monosiga brevicollis MX1]|uniref:Uncharacterized protein n=1 Tax=Monosiga brevicollis TaxID=81824 RepID=A9UUW6_MONBE|nr:uncharacterized protein MONBRDRAFT_6652 [Monosiga brevicollis MX1]EDQ90788.1 predicted protein [Monosiga brevicollis MX1]|eukprot:XP_001744085.1 hypothetical protein [Monosiga brevicollis MX1]
MPTGRTVTPPLDVDATTMGPGTPARANSSTMLGLVDDSTLEVVIVVAAAVGLLLLLLGIKTCCCRQRGHSSLVHRLEEGDGSVEDEVSERHCGWCCCCRDDAKGWSDGFELYASTQPEWDDSFDKGSTPQSDRLAKLRHKIYMNAQLLAQTDADTLHSEQALVVDGQPLATRA